MKLSRTAHVGMLLGVCIFFFGLAASFVASPASAQYYSNLYESKIVCPTCVKLGLSSKSVLGGINGRSFTFLSEFEKEYWDEAGNYHGHDLSCSYMHCSNNHLFRHYDAKCWCGWPFGTDIPDN